MNKENIIGLVLIAAILFGYSIWMAPSQEERLEAQRQRDSIAAVQRATEEAAKSRAQEQEPLDAGELDPVTDQSLPDSIVRQRLADRMGMFSRAGTGDETFYTIENEVLRLTISSMGGHVKQAELKGYRNHERGPLLLFLGEEDVFTMHFFSGNRQLSTDQLFFEPAYLDPRFEGRKEIGIAGSDSTRFSMRAYTDLHTPENPSYIEFLYGLKGEEYMVDFHMNFTGTQEAIAPNTTFLNLDWQVKLPRQEKNRTNEQNNSTVFYKFMNDETSRLRESRDGSERLPTTLEWISFKQQFFSSTLISRNGIANADVSSRFADEEDEAFIKILSASMNLAYDARQDNSYPMQFYFGPNHYRTLRSYEMSLERQIPIGWGFFLMSWINRYAVIPIFNFLDGFNLNYGIIILILTILLKIVLLPIAFKTYISQAKMRVLKPEVEELGKKFPKKEDAMKKQQATMALYKKAGVNPMAGCVPMLLQLPILLALFRFFPASIELRQEGFLWADDLSSYDSILDLPFTIPFYGDHVSLFTILMTVSTIFYTRLNSQMMGSSSQMPGMKTMMYFMPVMLMGIFNNFASGLSYYYFLANMITFGQMYLFRRFVDEKALHKKIEENKKKPVKKSKWQARMEELAKKQETQKRRK
jgi:YidC/Oxa1 family membrane protein insertase